MPVRLGKTPLLEGIFEVRFSPKITAAGDILPGLLYRLLKDEYPDVQPLPLASVPRALRSSDANLAYQAAHRLQGENTSIKVGDKVALLSATNYPGWVEFKKSVEKLVRELNKTDLVAKTERFSFRYINVLSMLHPEHQLDSLNVKFEVNGQRPIERGMHLRIEQDRDGFVAVIQMTANANAKRSDGSQIKGLLVDIDVIQNQVPTDFISSPTDLLERGHLVAKQLFYSLLTKDAYEALEPEY